MVTQLPTVLVTGASGFVAGHVIQELLRHGYVVRGTVRDVRRAEKLPHLSALATEFPGRLTLVTAHLDADEGWAEAVAGCTFVLHVASPNPSRLPRDENEVIRPAIDGTLRVLRAAAASDSVRRVVLTSSSTAVNAGHTEPRDGYYTEDDWAIVDGLPAYEKSKTLAERAAWQFHASLPTDRRFELAVVIPGLVLGPLNRPQVNASVEVIQRLLSHSIPAVPRLSFSPVDVRDVAVAHRLVMENAKASGNRYIFAGPDTWMEDMAQILAAEFAPRGFRIPRRRLPYWAMWLIARFDPTVRLALGYVGRLDRLSSRKATDELGWTTRPVADAVLATGHSLVDHNLVQPRPASSRSAK